MSISEKELKTLARLARLEFSDGELEEFSGGFDEMVEFANGVNGEVGGDTSSIREVSNGVVRWEDLREDEVEESLPDEKVTSNVSAENGYFAVRRVVK